ncbi:hypothetical protein [Endozoicomonas sp. ONNA1]|uniref:hypothetical protein n=1 Tax=Endozoicomonas sp. ONNA1 TaxID=2828740 RepID=UPI00214722F3|nr:hypothetical protein [Endozoicomonas sp. ONNA1]
MDQKPMSRMEGCKHTYRMTLDQGEGHIAAVSRAAKALIFGYRVSSVDNSRRYTPSPEASGSTLEEKSILARDVAATPPSPVLSKRAPVHFSRAILSAFSSETDKHQAAYLTECVSYNSKSGEIVPKTSWIGRLFRPKHKEPTRVEVNDSFKAALQNAFPDADVNKVFDACFSRGYDPATHKITEKEALLLLNALKLPPQKDSAQKPDNAAVDLTSDALVFQYDKESKSIMLVDDLRSYLIRRNGLDDSDTAYQTDFDIQYGQDHTALRQKLSHSFFKKAVKGWIKDMGGDSFNAGLIFKEARELALGIKEQPESFTGEDGIKMLKLMGNSPVLNLSQAGIQQFFPGGKNFSELLELVAKKIQYSNVPLPALTPEQERQFVANCRGAVREEVNKSIRDSREKLEKFEKEGKEITTNLISDAAIGSLLFTDELRKMALDEYIKLVSNAYSETLYNELKNRHNDG